MPFIRAATVRERSLALEGGRLLTRAALIGQDRLLVPEIVELVRMRGWRTIEAIPKPVHSTVQAWEHRRILDISPLTLPSPQRGEGFEIGSSRRGQERTRTGADESERGRERAGTRTVHRNEAQSSSFTKAWMSRPSIAPSPFTSARSMLQSG